MSQNIVQNVPSTQQAVQSIDQAQQYLADRAPKGGDGAQKTVNDVNEALKDAKNLVKEKNLGDAVSKLANDATAVGQKAAQHAKQAAQNAPSAEGAKAQGQQALSNAQAQSGVNQQDVERLSRDAHQAANQIRRAAQLTVTSPAFRRFLWNYYVLFRDTFAPQLDQAVEQRLKEGRKDDLTQKAEQKFSEVKQNANQQANQIQGQAQAKKDEVAGAAQQASQAAQQGDAATALATARDKTQQLGQQAQQAFNQQLTPERRQELVQRWNNLRAEVQKDPNLRAALDDFQATLARLRDDAQPLLNQANQKVGELKQVVLDKAEQAKQAGQQSAQQVQQSAHQTDAYGVRQVVQDARDLVEKFAEGKSLQDLTNVAQEWSTTLQNDQKLREWANNAWSWALTTKNDTNKINDDQHLQQLNSLIDQGRSFTQGQHKQIAERLFNESRQYLNALRNDRATNRLRQSLNNIVKDLFVDNTGKFVVKPDVYKQLSTALAPSFSDLFRDIRIAHVEEHNDDIDFAIDNIFIDASDIQPNQLDVKGITDVTLGKQDTGVDLRFQISAKGINPKLRNAQFRYERHSFPRLSDFGSVDAALTKDGLSFNIDVEFCANAKNNGEGRTFRANNVSVNLEGLKLDFHNAQHETLYKVFKPLIVKVATKQIERNIKDQLYSFADQLDEAATDARFRAEGAIEQVGGDRIVRGVDNNVGQVRT